MTKEITIQNLYHRLGEVTGPMTGEEYIQRMNAAGFEASLYELPEDMRKRIPAQVLEQRKQYSAKKENYSPLFYAGFWVYKDEEEDRLFMHSTIVTPNDTVKSYNLYSRIANTLLQLTIPEENADTYATDIVKALQGTGY